VKRSRSTKGRRGTAVAFLVRGGRKEEMHIELPPEKEKEAEGPKYKLYMNERRRCYEVEVLQSVCLSQLCFCYLFTMF
jgi:hypothetical protein